MTKTLNIEGMMCAHCVAHVEKAPVSYTHLDVYKRQV